MTTTPKFDDGGTSSQRSLWDDYAMAALTGMLAESPWNENTQSAVLAECCGRFADAMIAKKRRMEQGK